MGQAVAKVIRIAAREDLSLRFQAAEGAGVHDAVAIALKVIAVRMGRFGMAPSSRIFHVDGIVGELGVGSQWPAPSCQFTACVQDSGRS
jgi:hypothetical protein